MQVLTVGLHAGLVRVLQASLAGTTVDLRHFRDPAAALTAGESPADAWLLVDAAVLRDTSSALDLHQQAPHPPHSVLLCDEDMPCPNQMAREAGLSTWHWKSRLHDLGTHIATQAAA